ncbi:MAG: toll/interleukin-1 receptor domain-containing protein, partial [Clostridiales bacterium]|nr:toll/interleukin-1 receptor domain-containing protein [Clostridiales bacterium]
YLIAVCSPEYLKSPWCRKEIETFLRFHDRKHVLLVLADGEPMETFPPEIIYEDLYKIGPDGRPFWTKVQREPLAADCRGEDSKERNPKIDKAVIRIAAAILGVRFDDLQQRHRQEQYKRTRTRVLIAFGVLVAFLALCVGFLIKIAGQNRDILKQNEEIAMQNEIISLKYADTLAATSDNLLRDGKRKDAIYAARLALPDEETDNYSELATKALVNALGIYDLPNTFGCDNDVLLPCSVLDEMIISPNGGYASVKDLEYVRYVIDMNTGATVFSFEEDDFSYFTFDGEKGFVFKRADDNYFYFDFESGTETDLGVSKAFLYSNINGEGYATRNGESFVLYKGSEQVWNLNYSSEGFSDESRLEIAVNFIPGSDECWVFITDYDNRVTNAFVIDMLNGSSSKIFIANTVCFDIATDGKNIVWKDIEEYNYSLWIMDINSGTVKSRYVNDSYRLVVLNDYVVTITDGSVSILDKDLNDVDQFEASGYIRAFVFSDELVLLDGSGMMYKIRDGRYTCYDTGLSNEYLSWMQEYRDGKLYAAQTGDNHIYTYTFRQSDYMVVTSGDYEDLMSDYYDIIQIHEDPDVSDFVDLVMQNETEFQENRIIRVVMCHNAELGLIQLYDGAVFIYDSSTGEKIKTIYSLESFVNMFYYDEQSGYYYLSSNNVDVYDSNFKNIYSIRNCILSGIEKQSGAIVVLDLTFSDPNNYTGHYTVYPVTYDQLISLTDDYLSGYEPDERVKEKYSLG